MSNMYCLPNGMRSCLKLRDQIDKSGKMNKCGPLQARILTLSHIEHTRYSFLKNNLKKTKKVLDILGLACYYIEAVRESPLREALRQRLYLEN
jgi:hypothetical protein